MRRPLVATVEENPDGDKRGEDTICDDERAMVRGDVEDECESLEG